MNSAVQNLLLSVYRAARASGVLSTGPGRALFEAGYLLYKAHVEAPHIRHLRGLIRPGSWAIDVGANIGVFTRRFAEWVGTSGRVLALEPEAENFAALCRHIRQGGIEGLIEPLQAAASAASGMQHLAVNRDHPGDHRLAPEGVPVTTHALDDLLAERGSPDVSLIKIDVQGAEEDVIAGATRTLDRCQPALFIEVYDAGLRQFGSSSASLIHGLAARGYGVHELLSGGISPEVPVEQAVQKASVDAAYIDYVFMAKRR